MGISLLLGACSNAKLTAHKTTEAKIIPAMPAIKDNTTDSVKICLIMVAGVAPNALRMPISWVRSFTIISIIFTIPIIPEPKIKMPTI